jgi:hypothetical protein
MKIRNILLVFMILPLFGLSQDTTFKHIYHLNRLQVIKPDTTITGIVTRVTDEIDGDWHIVLDGKIEAEIICACTIKVPDAATACEGYKNNFLKPKKGQRITVQGPYVEDLHHKWFEVHPVKTLLINK